MEMVVGTLYTLYHLILTTNMHMYISDIAYKMEHLLCAGVTSKPHKNPVRLINGLLVKPHKKGGVINYLHFYK